MTGRSVGAAQGRREGDETFLSLETIAAIYRVDRIWLREVFEFGLLESGFERDATVWIAAVELDHVATLVRLRAVCGADVSTIALLLGR